MGAKQKEKVLGVFSTKKPRDAGAGLSSGLKSTAKGVGLGVAALFSGPVIGAKEAGAKGFCKGCVGGLACAVALPVAGIGVGVYQGARGFANTPEAIKRRNQGKVWDKKNRRWVLDNYSLDEEVLEVEQLDASGAFKGTNRDAGGGGSSPDGEGAAAPARHPTAGGGGASSPTRSSTICSTSPRRPRREKSGGPTTRPRRNATRTNTLEMRRRPRDFRSSGRRTRCSGAPRGGTSTT
eukprot:GHVU01084765.1.p1 GENE.GHVU01084765.1~~GHVU01084765.1.p1  ORF type:complete len:237 (+),score=34.41 GHVU01084765.1:367-1077(+)